MNKFLPYSFIAILAMCPALLNGQAVQKKSFTGGRDAGVCFAIGNKLYSGGGVGYKDFMEYDPATDTWTSKGNLPGVKYQRAFGVSFTINGKGYAGMGADSANAKIMFDLWEYDAATNQWTQKADFPGQAPDGCAWFVLNNKAYVVGGTDNQLIYSTVHEYDPVTNTWRKLNGNYPSSLIFGSGFSIGNYGYVTCGASTGEIRDTYRFDPSDESWTTVAEFPGTARQTAVSFTIGQMAWVGGGQSGYTNAYKDFYRYNAANDTWALAGDIGTQGRAWGVAATVNGKAYIGTGWDFGASFFNDWWEFTPQNIASIKETAANTGIAVYNDMAGGLVNIAYSFDVSEDCRTQLFDLTGKVVWESVSGNSGVTIPVNGLAAGIYMLNVTNAGANYREKVTVIK